MKLTFKTDKLGRIIPVQGAGITRPGKKTNSLRPKKSMTRSKSLKRYVLTGQIATEQMGNTEE